MRFLSSISVFKGKDRTVCGGFTDIAFSNRKGGYIYSDHAFLFSYNNENNQPKKFEIIKKLYAICYHAGCGPIFGAGMN